MEGDYITITLRKSRKSHRDSNAHAWDNFARTVKERVVVIPDYDVKKIHLHDRMALYEGAKMNFFASQGPAVLGYYSDAPYAVLNMHPTDGDRDKKYLDFEGLEKEFQWPWANSRQRIFWKPDISSNITEAYEWAQTTY